MRTRYRTAGGVRGTVNVADGAVEVSAVTHANPVHRCRTVLRACGDDVTVTFSWVVVTSRTTCTVRGARIVTNAPAPPGE